MSKVGTLYVITNDLNDNKYIGITYKPIEGRWQIHKTTAKNINTSTKLARAIRELGVEHFKIREIGRFEQGTLEEKEIEYIEKYDTFHNGYNGNLGGYTGKLIDYEKESKIIDSINKGMSLMDIAIENKVSMVKVKQIAKINGLNIAVGNAKCANIAKVVYAFMLDTGEELKFESMANAYKYFINTYNNKIRKGHFYYQVRYSINTGNIAYNAIWSSDEINNTEKAQSLFTERQNKIINKLYIEPRVKSNAYADRQVPEDLYIRYPFIKEELQQLYPKYTVNSIANHIGISYSTVNKWLKRYGIK